MNRRTSEHFGSIKFLFVYVFYPILYRFIVQLWEIQAWTLKYLMSSMKRPKKQGQKMQFLTLFFCSLFSSKNHFSPSIPRSQRASCAETCPRPLRLLSDSPLCIAKPRRARALKGCTTRILFYAAPS